MLAVRPGIQKKRMQRMFQKRKARSLVYSLLRKETIPSASQKLLITPDPATVPYLIELLQAESDRSVNGHKFLSKASGQKIECYEVYPTAASKIAAKALVPLADKRAMNVFRLLLTSEDSELRRTATEGLCQLGEKHWKDYINGDDSDHTRLAKSQDPSAWKLLCLGLRHQSAAAADACREACESIGSGIVPSLIEELRTGCSRASAAIALGAIGDKRASEPLMKALSDRDEYVAGSAARALGAMREKQAYEKLSRLLSLQSCRGRMIVCDVAFALGRLQDHRATEALLSIADCDIQQYALAAVRALGDLGDSSAWYALACLLNKSAQELAKKFSLNPTAMSFSEACQSMASNPAAMAVAGWVGKVREADELRAEAAISLGKLGDPQGIPNLEIALCDPNSDVQAAAAAALEGLGSPGVAGPKNWAACDVCRKHVHRHSGFVLSTRDVVTSFSYWVFAFKGAEEAVHLSGEYETSRMYHGHILQQCSQTTGWLVCDHCMILFPSADRQRAEANALAYWDLDADGDYVPPNGGSVEPEEARVAAAIAWKKVTGTRVPSDCS